MALSEDEDTAVEIPDMGFSEARFGAHLVGSSPLLMHNPSAMQAAGTINRGGTEVPPPDMEAEQGTYRLPTGEHYVPARCIRGSMKGAAVMFQNPSHQRGTLQGRSAGR